MDKKELLEKYLMKEVEVSVPQYYAHYDIGSETHSYIMTGFTKTIVRQLDVEKLIELLSKFVKVSDIIK